MLFWLLAGLVVYLANIFLPMFLFLPAEGFFAHFGSRDKLPEPNVAVGRARRALVNFQENLPIFLGLGILALVVSGANMEQAILGAQLFVLSRIAFIAFYMIAIPITRTVAYVVGLIGLILMAFALI